VAPAISLFVLELTSGMRKDIRRLLRECFEGTSKQKFTVALIGRMPQGNPAGAFRAHVQSLCADLVSELNQKFPKIGDPLRTSFRTMEVQVSGSDGGMIDPRDPFAEPPHFSKEVVVTMWIKGRSTGSDTATSATAGDRPPSEFLELIAICPEAAEISGADQGLESGGSAAGHGLTFPDFLEASREVTYSPWKLMIPPLINVNSVKWNAKKAEARKLTAEPCSQSGTPVAVLQHIIVSFSKRRDEIFVAPTWNAQAIKAVMFDMPSPSR
jgi:hypothetical protein